MSENHGKQQQLSAQMVGVAEQPQVIVVPLSMVSKKTEKYREVVYGLGVAEVVLGCVSALLAILTLIMTIGSRPGQHSLFDGRIFTFPSQGIWCGAVIVTSGVLGIVAKHRPSVCVHNANIALSIIAAIMMLVLVIFSAIAALFSWSVGVRATHIVVGLIGLTGFIVSIVHSAYCCAGVCCDKANVPGNVAYIPQPSVLQVEEGSTVGTTMHTTDQTISPELLQSSLQFSPLPREKGMRASSTGEEEIDRPTILQRSGRFIAVFANLVEPFHIFHKNLF